MVTELTELTHEFNQVGQQVLGLGKRFPHPFSASDWWDNSSNIPQINRRKSNFYTCAENSYKHGNFKDSEVTSGMYDILDKGEKRGMRYQILEVRMGDSQGVEEE